MAERDFELDEGLRHRLLGLVEQAQQAQPPARLARERAIRATVWRARTVRRTRWLAGAGALVAAAGVAMLVLPPLRQSETAPPPASPALAMAPDAAPSCPLQQAVAELAEHDEQPGRRELVFGRHARVLADAGSELRAGFAAPCTLELSLRRGRISVHARDLAGGRLRVDTELGQIIVAGTVFSVALIEGDDGEGSLAVSLAEGRVRVLPVGAPAVALTPGERMWVDAAGLVRRESQTEAERVALLAEHAIAPPAPPAASERVGQVDQEGRADQPGAASRSRSGAAPGADRLLSLADAARNRGRHERARELYQQAGAGSGLASEAAWMRLSQLELQAGRLAHARRALRTYGQRFPTGALRAEAAWLRVRLAQRAGDEPGARAAAEAVVDAHPRSPQAKAARRLLGSARP